MLKKMPLWAVICAVLILIFVIIVIFIKPKSKTMLLPDGQKVSVELAVSNFQKSRGLMYRKSLGENEGMLFVYSTPAKYIFWMKNTLIPLDMIWLDENFKIVDIAKNVPPCKTEKCQTYMPKEKATYILEVNQGYADKHGLTVGAALVLQK